MYTKLTRFPVTSKLSWNFSLLINCTKTTSTNKLQENYCLWKNYINLLNDEVKIFSLKKQKNKKNIVTLFIDEPHENCNSHWCITNTGTVLIDHLHWVEKKNIRTSKYDGPADLILRRQFGPTILPSASGVYDRGYPTHRLYLAPYLRIYLPLTSAPTEGYPQRERGYPRREGEGIPTEGRRDTHSHMGSDSGLPHPVLLVRFIRVLS